MKTLTSFFYLSLSILFITFYTACGSADSNDQDNDKTILKQASKIHNEAINIGLQIAPSLEEIKQIRNRINVQGRALTDQEMQFATKVDQLESSHRFWLEHLIEVPGFGHDHGHDHSGHDHSGHDHSHDHSHGSTNQPTLTPDQMLTAQKEIRDTILMIQQKLDVLKGLAEGL